jgi:hypothetical protein
MALATDPASGAILEQVTFTTQTGGKGGGLAYNEVAASTAVASTSAETLFDKNYSIPPNTLVAGSKINIKFQGIATTTVGSDTLQIKVYLGGLSGTALLTSTATDATNSDVFAGECDVTVRTAGATGTFVAFGSFTKVEGASGTATRVDSITASTTINTQAAQVVGVSGTWNSTNANSCRLDILSVSIT